MNFAAKYILGLVVMHGGGGCSSSNSSNDIKLRVNTIVKRLFVKVFPAEISEWVSSFSLSSFVDPGAGNIARLYHLVTNTVHITIGIISFSFAI